MGDGESWYGRGSSRQGREWYHYPIIVETNFIFDNKVFCEYGLYHLLFLVFLGPFSAPIIAAISGWMVVKNLHFFNLSLLCLGQTLVWAAFMYTMICFFTPSTTVIYTSELIYVLLSISISYVNIPSYADRCNRLQICHIFPCWPPSA
jgi:hypothetical protein